MIPVPKNKLQEQFEFEKAQLEKYGYVSSMTYEEWLKLKEGDKQQTQNNEQWTEHQECTCTFTNARNVKHTEQTDARGWMS